MTRSIERTVVVSVVLVAVVLVGVVAPAAFLHAQRADLERRIGRAREARVAVDDLWEVLTRVDREARNAVLTGEERSMARLRAAMTGVDEAMEALGVLAADDPEQRRRLRALRPLVSRRVEIASEVVEARRAGGVEAAIRTSVERGGDALMPRIRALVTEIEGEELHRIEALARTVGAKQGWSLLAQSIGLVANLAVLGLMVAAVFRAMARRRLLERDLRRSEQRFRESFDAAACGMALVGPAGRFLKVNRALCEILGRDEGTLTAMTFQELTHPDDLGTDLEQLRALAAGRIRSYRMEKRYVHTDGRIIWVMLSTSAARDESGAPLHYVALIEDITARKRAEAALAEGERRFRAIFDGTYQFVGLLSPDGTVLEANRPALEFGGLGRDGVIGRPIWAALGESIDERTRGRVRSAVAEAAAGEFVRFEVDLRGAGGDRATIDFSIKPVRDEEGRVVLLIPEGRDITGRKRIEREREQIIQQLERTRAEAERDAVELAAARDRALAAVRAKEVFLASISHEIRTPMTGIIATADLLARTRLDRGQLDHVSTIRSSGEALQAILDDILDLSKIEAGRMDLEAEPMDPRSLVEDVAALMAAPAHRKGLRLHELVAAEVPARLIGDPMRLRQILLNLVGNAVKFTDRGEVALEVRRIDSGPAGETISISVTDSGIGIAPEDQEAIFRSFTQVSTGPGRRRAGGTGLGLTISRHLAHLMGGRIELESRPGVGSTFRLVVTLPLASRPDGGEPEPIGPPELRGLPVLVVAQADLGSDSLVEQLRSWGCLPGRLDSAEAARQRLDGGPESDRPRLLVLDSELACELDRTIGPGPKPPRVLIRRAGAHDPADLGRGAPTVCEPVRRSALQEAILQALRPVAVVSASIPGQSALPQLGLRVLLAEDYETNRDLVCQMLRLLGCRADAVPDGAQAVKAAAVGSYDLILMDLEMPGVDGMQAAVEIRRQERDSGLRTPIYAFTAHAMDDDRRQCLALGMDGIISKPLRLATLSTFLVNFEESRRRPASRPEAPALAPVSDPVQGTIVG